MVEAQRPTQGERRRGEQVDSPDDAAHLDALGPVGLGEVQPDEVAGGQCPGVADAQPGAAGGDAVDEQPLGFGRGGQGRYVEVGSARARCAQAGCQPQQRRRPGSTAELVGPGPPAGQCHGRGVQGRSPPGEVERVGAHGHRHRRTPQPQHAQVGGCEPGLGGERHLLAVGLMAGGPDHHLQYVCVAGQDRQHPRGHADQPDEAARSHPGQQPRQVPDDLHRPGDRGPGEVVDELDDHDRLEQLVAVPRLEAADGVGAVSDRDDAAAHGVPPTTTAGSTIGTRTGGPTWSRVGASMSTTVTS